MKLSSRILAFLLALVFILGSLTGCQDIDFNEILAGLNGAVNPDEGENPGETEENGNPADKPNDGTEDGDPTDKPNDGTEDSDPTDKPNDGAEDGDPTDKPNGGTEDGNPTDKPNGGTEDGDPTDKPGDGTEDGNPTDKPNGGTEDGDPTDKPNDGTEDGDPTDKPSDGTEDGDPTDKPNDGTEDGDQPEDDYVFGSEYPCITVERALELAKDYSSKPSVEKYYLVATVTEVVSFYTGEMYIADDTGSIYVYQSTYIDGGSLSGTALEVGDVLIISGTLRNYKGLLEVQTGTVIDFYTPGEDTPEKPGGGTTPDDGGDTTTPDEGGDTTTPDDGGSGTNPGGGNSSGGGSTTTPDFSTDPYVGVNKTEFYANYKPAVSLADALYRSKHFLMSGLIGEQDQAPTIAQNRPTDGGLFVRNTSAIYEDNGDTYVVLDAQGNIAFRIYRGGAYIMLEEVAAYVYAFGDFPANHVSSKSTKPTSNPWGIYLRLNHSYFSGDTDRYPYEPILPDISGCGGELRYYEMDIGTTGTDCDPDYKPAIYNNGSSITRGAARIVYARQDKNGNGIIEPTECYVFYTYNHYNDFQEYLNYAGGWGEMFGNITGGGTISSKNDYNPTEYVPTALRDFSASAAASTEIILVSPEIVNYILQSEKKYA